MLRALEQVQWGSVAALAVAVPLLSACMARLMRFGWSPLTALAWAPASLPGGALLFGRFSFLQTCVLLVLAGPLLNLPHHAWNLERKLDQSDRDDRAREIAGRLTADDPDSGVPPFAVYLRPFGSENLLATQPYSVVSGEIPQHIDAESLLQRALAPRLSLVALGAPAAQQASGRFVAGEDAWQETASLLIRWARLLILLPSDRAGTMWEIRAIVQEGVLDRTIFLMPETPPAGGGGIVTEIGPKKQFGITRERVHFRDHASEWAAARAAVRTEGLELPEYDDRGAVFTMAGDGSVLRMLPLELTRRARKVRALRDLLGEIGREQAAAGAAAFSERLGREADAGNRPS